MKTHQEAINFKNFLKELIPSIEISTVLMDNVGLEPFPYGVRIDFSPEYYENIFAFGGQFFKSKNGYGKEYFEVEDSESIILGYVIAYNLACAQLGTIHASKTGFFTKTVRMEAELLDEKMRMLAGVREMLIQPREEHNLTNEQKQMCALWLRSLDEMAKQALR
jgi:hypothetical protein